MEYLKCYKYTNKNKCTFVFTALKQIDEYIGLQNIFTLQNIFALKQSFLNSILQRTLGSRLIHKQN